MRVISSVMYSVALVAAISFSCQGCLISSLPLPVQGKFVTYERNPDARQRALIDYIAKRTVRVLIYQQVVDKDKPSTLNWKYAGHGTGSILNYKNGYSYIMTAKHVSPCMKKSYMGDKEIRYAYSIEYRDRNNKIISTLWGAEVVATSELTDISILRIFHNYGVKSVLARNIHLGQKVHILGYPGLRGIKGAHLSYSHADVSTINIGKKNALRNIPMLLRYGGAGYFGNSGGAVWNYNGEIIGTVTMITGFRTLMGSFVPQQDCTYGPSVFAVRALLINKNLQKLMH